MSNEKEHLMADVVCEFCGTAFRVRTHRVAHAKFCSHSCCAKRKRPLQTLAFIEKMTKQLENTPDKVLCRHVLREAVKTRLIVQQPCAICGKEKADAHHSDYSKPLLVTWLCRKHHIALHVEMGSYKDQKRKRKAK